MFHTKLKHVRAILVAFLIAPLTAMAAGMQEDDPNNPMNQDNPDSVYTQPQEEGMDMEEPAPISSEAEEANNTNMATTTDSTVHEVQSALNEKGFNVQVDGIMGNETRTALKNFQERQGLETTGQIDQATLSAMNIGSDSLEREPASVEQPRNPDTDASDQYNPGTTDGTPMPDEDLTEDPEYTDDASDL